MANWDDWLDRLDLAVALATFGAGLWLGSSALAVAGLGFVLLALGGAGRRLRGWVLGALLVRRRAAGGWGRRWS